MSRSSAKFVVLAVRSFSRAAASAACSVFCRRCKSVMVYGRCFSRRSFCSGPLSLLAFVRTLFVRLCFGWRCAYNPYSVSRLAYGLHELCALDLRSFQCNGYSKPKGFLIAERRRMLSRDRVIGRPGSAQKSYFARVIVIWWITALLERFLTVPKTPFWPILSVICPLFTPLFGKLSTIVHNFFTHFPKNVGFWCIIFYTDYILILYWIERFRTLLERGMYTDISGSYPPWEKRLRTDDAQRLHRNLWISCGQLCFFSW